MNKKLFLFLIITISVSNTLLAQNSERRDSRSRPKIGLALSGGGAKGFAHIGVLMALEEYGIPIDYIAGTSIGSIIGGLYAIGYTPAEMDSIIRKVDWIELFTGAANRRRLTMAEKPWDSRYMITLPIRQRSVQLPSGLLAGWKITALLSELTWPAHSIHDFNKFPIPFGCVAADIETGEAVFIRSGFLPEAMKASMAVPSVIPPVLRQGRKLVDGGLSRNLPADDVRGMGADIVIGIDVGTRPKSAKEMVSMLDYVNQIIILHMNESTRIQRERCDILITPKLGELDFSAFGNTENLIEIGLQAVRAQENALLALRDSLAKFHGSQKAFERAAPLRLDSLFIEKIEIKGLRHVSHGLVNAELTINAGQWVTRDQLSSGIERLFNSQFFEHISYRILPEAEGHRLVVTVREKNTALFRLGTRFDSRNEASVLFNTTFRNLTGQGSALALDLAIAGKSTFDATYFVHTGILPGLGVRLRMRFNEKPIDFFTDGNREARIKAQEYLGEIFIGSLFSSSVLLGAGLRGEIDRTFPDIAPANYDDTTRYVGAAFAIFHWDTFDKTDFPRAGHSFKIEGEYASPGLGGNVAYRRLFFDWQTAIPFSKRISVLTRLQAGHLDSDDFPFQKQFFLGGVDSFIGLRPDEIFGGNMQAVMFGLQVELWKRRYIILRYNAGNVFGDWRFRPRWREFMSGFGVTLGVQTPLGPVEVSLAYSRTSKFLTPFNLGYKF